MLTTLVQSLALASGGILSAGSITIVILLLISDKGWRNGVAYASGYIIGYTFIGMSVILAGYTASEPGTQEEGSGLFASVLFITFGVLLVILAVRNWRKPPSDEAKPPRFFSILDKITPLRSFALGAAVTVINFKNLAIFLSAVSVLHLSDLLLPTKLVIIVLIVLVFCVAVIVPVVIYFTFPDSAPERLNWIRQSLEKHSRTIGIWIPLIFGLIFLIRGITGLL